MEEIEAQKKALMELYKVKLDLLKPTLNTLLLFFGGAVSFLVINFEKNGILVNIIISCGIVILLFCLSMITKEIIKTYGLMKGLI